MGICLLSQNTTRRTRATSWLVCLFHSSVPLEIRDLARCCRLSLSFIIKPFQPPEAKKKRTLKKLLNLLKDVLWSVKVNCGHVSQCLQRWVYELNVSVSLAAGWVADRFKNGRTTSTWWHFQPTSASLPVAQTRPVLFVRVALFTHNVVENNQRHCSSEWVKAAAGFCFCVTLTAWQTCSYAIIAQVLRRSAIQ